MDVKEIISIDGRLVHDTAQIQNTDTAWLISLWHDETAIYQDLSFLEIDLFVCEFH